MSCIQLPHIFYSGIDSFSKIFDKDYESVLIISDGNLSAKSGAILKLKRTFDAQVVRNEIIISDNADELFERAKKYADSHLPEALIAIGNGRTLDCGAAVSKLCGIPLVTVIETLPCALSEFDTLDPFLYKNAADILITDPSFITLCDSSKIAYEALGTAVLVLESAVVCPEKYLRAAAAEAFCEIYRNILPSYRGEISARENLLYALTWAHTAYINSFSYSWQSAAFRTVSFFSKWSRDRISILAVSAANLSEYLCENFYENFSALSQRISHSPLSENAPAFLIDEIRRIQATLSVPYALKNFMIDEKEFAAECEGISDEDRDLFYKCYYGNISFVKL